MSEAAPRELTVGEAHAGARLDVFLAWACPELSRNALQRLVKQGEVRRADAGAGALRPSTRLVAGERLLLSVPPPVSSDVVAQDLPLDVIYEDADLIVVNKAPGMVVHPAAGHADGTLVNALLHHVDDLSGVGGVARPGIVHRLDRDTSGLMVVCKHDASHQAMSARFKAREVHKVYTLVAYGALPERLDLDTPYGRHPKDRKRYTSQVGERRAITKFRGTGRYQTGARGIQLSTGEATLVTGRTHQIRVHAADAGYPLVGEQTYARPERQLKRVGDAGLRTQLRDFGRQALHAARLRFVHPLRDEELELEAPPPADFAALLEALDAHRIPDADGR